MRLKTALARLNGTILTVLALLTTANLTVWAPFITAEPPVSAHGQTADAPKAGQSAPRSDALPTQRRSGTGPNAPAAIKHASTSDFVNQPLVVERYATEVQFNDDGTSTKTIRARIRVQSDAGVQQLAELIFHYNAPAEQNEVHYVRVIRPDGKIVLAAKGAIQESPAPIAHDAPAFSGLQETHVAVPSLSAGDILEYEVATHTASTPAARNFWFEHHFVDDAIVLNETLEIEIPANRTVKIKSPGFDYAVHEDAADHRKIYEFKHTNLKLPPAEQSSDAAATEKARPPEVELTTFSSWPEVAHWYGEMERTAMSPAPALRAKADQMTRGLTSSTEKTEALYDYVSKNIHYIALPYGQGAYRSHTAAEVLTNGYGDSNDQAILLSAMLRAAGIDADIALASSSRALDVSLPSPAQFDHALVAVHDGSGLLWMDTTPGVAPFRMLAASLRDKSALLISGQGAGDIHRTPADPPFRSMQNAEITGDVSRLGKLTASAHYTLRGDTELVLRVAFQHTPKEKWKEVAQTMLRLDGIQGMVSSVAPSDPADTRAPFQLNIAFTQVNYLDWASKTQRLLLPLAVLGLPDAPSSKKNPIEIGSPLDVTSKITLTLPDSYSAQAPTATSVNRDYADYKSSYDFEGHTLQAERELSFKMHELPPARSEDYAAFTRAVQSDEAQKFLAINSEKEPAVPGAATADELFESGTAALDAGNAQSALPLLEKTAALDPQRKAIWDQIGLARLRLRQLGAAAAAFRKQIDLDPKSEHSYEYLGAILEEEHDNTGAMAAFRKQIEIEPLDKAALAALGSLYLEEHDYGNAIAQLEKAAILSPDNAALRIELGTAYASTGSSEKAITALKQAVALSPTPGVHNDAAYILAENKLDIDEAQVYAFAAISQTAEQIKNLKWPEDENAALRLSENLGNYWDTAGWIDFQKGKLGEAEQYLTAAWRLNEQGETASHLAQVAAKRGDKEGAIRFYALSLAAPQPDIESRARLTLLLGSNTGIDALIEKARPEIEALRTVRAGQLLDDAAKADFTIELSAGAKSARVRFAGGDERLRAFTERLQTIDYGVVLPNAAARIFRRGTLTCGKGGECTLVLSIP